MIDVIIDQVWQDFLKIIRDEVGTRIIETWIKAVSISYYDTIKREMYISAPNLFVKNWVELHYKELFTKHLMRLLSVEQLTIYFTVQNGHQVATMHESAKIMPAVQIQQPKKKRTDIVKKTVSSYDGCMKLNPAYQFDTFVIGDNNQFAYASARAVAEKLGTLYNPLLLYGGSGLGKTHLLHAIGNHIQEHQPNVVVMYQTTDRFITEFINAIRFDSVAKFQAKYKQVDVLLVDDIQFMVNKEQTQEIFFQIFNNLYETNKQIILSSDTLPRYLGGLVDRLKSRLEWGLVADVQVPMLETKVAILKRKAYMQKEVLPDDVALVIAQQDIASIRELEGSLIRVLAYASLTNHPLTVDLVHKVLGVVQEHKSAVAPVDFRVIMQYVKKHFSYDIDQLRSKDRSKGISLARHVAMYLMKRYTNSSLREIGEFLQRNDHTTITHAVQRITMLRTCDEHISNVLKNIEEELRG
ncbi:chromosomal replication initiator protein DnaA [Candidatus Babeliales bacterium]|nr:chromosomal replication initiator protein DnaA [Candidatus Babeliales bacterium]